MKRKWIGKPSPKSMRAGTGWFGELDRCWADEKMEYAVMARDVHNEWGTMTHIVIRNAAGTDVPWMEKQKIKDELFGSYRTAVEVFPAAEELVDEANMYHLWLLPLGVSLPFTIASGGAK